MVRNGEGVNREFRSKGDGRSAAALIRPMALDAALRGGLEKSDDASLLIVPGTDAMVGNLPEKRRAKFRDYLLETIAEAFSRRRASKASRPDRTKGNAGIAEMLAAACATCRGHCCRTGGEHAYLDAKTIRRVLAGTPSSTPSSLLETYLAALPAKSVRGSCVFHGSAGCTLPRRLRSHVCNDFFCGPVDRWLASPAASEAKPAVIVVVDGGRVTRSTYVDRRGPTNSDR